MLPLNVVLGKQVTYNHIDRLRNGGCLHHHSNHPIAKEIYNLYVLGFSCAYEDRMRQQYSPIAWISTQLNPRLMALASWHRKVGDIQMLNGNEETCIKSPFLKDVLIQEEHNS